MKTIISLYRWVLGSLVFVVACSVVLIITFALPGLRYRGATWLSRSVVWALGIRLQVEGHLPPGQAHIIMANHASFADPFIIAACMTGKYTGIMAEESMQVPLWRALLKRYQIIPIRRKNSAAARSSIKLAEERIRAGYNVIIMPEGTRTLNGQLGALKKGGFHLARDARAPILVMGIEGAFRFKPKSTWQLQPGPVVVRIGQPLAFEDYRDLTLDQLMEIVRQQLERLSAGSSAN